MFCLLIPALAIACGAPPQREKPLVYAAIPPYGFLVQRVAGENIRVGVLVASGQSPHTYEPTPRQVSELARSRIYFESGMGFEKVLLGRLRSSFPDLQNVELNRGLELIPMEEGEAEHEDHGHAPGEPDPHTWLDPRLAKAQAGTIREALSTAFPKLEAEFSTNLARLESELDSVDTLVAGILAPHRGKTFYVFHPSFGYFAASYGLVQRAVEIGGREPSARQLAALVEHLRQEHARVLFIQPQFPESAARSLEQSLGVRLEVLDPLAQDYSDNLVRMARAIAASLSE